MLENAWMVIYFANVLDGVCGLFILTSIITGISSLICGIGVLLEDIKFKPLKLLIPIFFLSTLLAILIPSKEVVYIYVGGKVATSAIEEFGNSKYPKEIQKTIDNILSKVNAELENKEIEAK